MMKGALQLLLVVGLAGLRPAAAESLESQLWQAAVQSAVIDGRQDSPQFRRALLAAFSSSSSKHAHERLLLWLGSVPLEAGETLVLPPQRVCHFYERVNALAAMQSDVSWQAQLFLNETFFETLLYDDPRDQRKDRACGAGILRSLTLTQRANDRTLELVFSKDLNLMNKRLDLVVKSGGAYDVAGGYKGVLLRFHRDGALLSAVVQRFFEQRDKSKFGTRLSNYNDFLAARGKPIDRGELEQSLRRFGPLYERYASGERGEDFLQETTAAARAVLAQHANNGFAAGNDLLDVLLAGTAATDFVLNMENERGRLEVGSGRGSARYTQLSFWLPSDQGPLLSISEVHNGFVGHLQRAAGAFMLPY